jgi:small-conductance mechanosensitive channel
MEKMLASLQKTFLSLLDQVVVGFSKLFGALMLLLIGWIIARLITRLLGKLLGRIGGNQLSDKLNEIPSLQKAGIKLDLVLIIKKFLYWLIMLVFFISAADVMGLGMISDKLNQLIDYLPQVFTALLILVGGFYLADQLRNLIGSAAKSMGIPSHKAISGLVFYVMVIFVVIAALERLSFFPVEIITDNLSIILGGILLAFAIGYGLAARPMLSSILASYYSRNTFEVGQEIELDGHRGTIVRMTNVSLTIDTGNHRLILPLSRLLSDQVIIHAEARREQPLPSED